MTWIIIAVLIVVFIVGYRVLTSDTRKAVDTLANLLKIKPIYIESMLQEMGQRQTQMFIRSTSNGYAEDVRKAAYLVFIYQTFIKDPSDENVMQWRNTLIRSHISPMLTAEHTEAALFYFAELDLDAFELAQFRRNYNLQFNQEADAVLH
ncbi:Protein of uncharacterised function (DUF1198) [Yersinia frederiksenii]|uniref:DUF1198 domain-containing protein n=1 Tax=Yersinia alsatica TaxID=2890317 RepID=A0ABY5UWW5_9GAMM|nr:MULTISPECIES: DUF1198 domain-containing protein [Yersinia]OVZ91379.1 hypothetical protein CBW58_12365 [Yersinia frederiksenii]OWF67750.1 hypothetical protein B4901_17155 [Yersinia frederiksenii]OWF80367.1 hypothetical protein B4903_09585 [Yersinia frederiksenii]UWM46787.1 DUF1198 domain-containing protein [Yersinia alsatica]CND11667.1 Protein of uncharacterised function (DUF1198) [Yersinia frederiksenii]